MYLFLKSYSENSYILFFRGEICILSKVDQIALSQDRQVVFEWQESLIWHRQTDEQSDNNGRYRTG